MTTGEKIKNLLDKKGRGAQAALARATGDKPPTISKWIKGVQKIPTHKIKAVADFLGVSTDYLLDDSMDVPLERFIPLIGYASCGVPSVHYYGEDTELLPVSSDINADTCYAIRAIGDSMEPTISDGDIVICDSEKPPSDNAIIHYTFDGESGIKRALRQQDGSVILMPDNPSCDGCTPVIVPKDRTKDISAARCIRVIKPL